MWTRNNINFKTNLKTEMTVVKSLGLPETCNQPYDVHETFYVMVRVKPQRHNH